ncbi:hypothetical protein MnTg04_01370 [bacterium MnTg04]|nr:hypothetical protein MnTg04_01370 [bacterium MnTg04]
MQVGSKLKKPNAPLVPSEERELSMSLKSSQPVRFMPLARS